MFQFFLWPIADLPQRQAPPTVVKITGAAAGPCASEGAYAENRLVWQSFAA